ncbi:RHS repeat-associated core domain-containing protein [Streptomyces misionensis]|uniref:RHS repeat-associated core domain-containing protein n=1 Tax=Streptomyces misionensis TaxID=67331 RepID=UPI0038173C0B
MPGLAADGPERRRAQLGRLMSYTDADGAVTTTQYDALDRPIKVTDSVPSTTTYAYDTSIDPRGLTTSITDSVAGTFGVRYDADGELNKETMPGGYTMTEAKDPDGTATSRTYTRDSDSTVLLADSITETTQGQWATHAGTPGITASQAYAYDKAGRLSQVQDTTPDAVCTTRAYTFDKDTNRRTLATSTATVGTDCTTSGATTTTNTYDSADRLVNSGYTYDTFGRTTALPGTTIGHRHRNADPQRRRPGRQPHRHHHQDRRRHPPAGQPARRHRPATARRQQHRADRPRLRRIRQPAHRPARHPLRLARRQTALQRNSHRPHPHGRTPLQPHSGRFLSADPIPGGSANTYEYCNGDPINHFDLDGRSWRFARTLWRNRRVQSLANNVVAVGAIAPYAVYAGAYHVRRWFGRWGNSYLLTLEIAGLRADERLDDFKRRHLGRHEDTYDEHIHGSYCPRFMMGRRPGMEYISK